MLSALYAVVRPSIHLPVTRLDQSQTVAVGKKRECGMRE